MNHSFQRIICLFLLLGSFCLVGKAVEPASTTLSDEQVETILQQVERKIVEDLTHKYRDKERYLLLLSERRSDGLVTRFQELKNELKINEDLSLLAAAERLEKELGIEEDPGKPLGLVDRLVRLEAKYSKKISDQIDDKVADLFEEQYGIPSKMAMGQRLEKTERYMDDVFLDSRFKHQNLDTPETRMKILQEMFPEVAGNLGTVERNLPRFEKAFEILLPEDKELSMAERLTAVERAAKGYYFAQVNEKRKQQSAAGRALGLRKLLNACSVK